MDRPLNTNFHSALQAEQVQVLYRNIPAAIGANVLNASVLAGVLLPAVPACPYCRLVVEGSMANKYRIK
jgi:hypothetical protein